MSNADVQDVPRLPAALAGFIFAGAIAALAGGYWDDAWHTERGRDDFFIAPHIAIYAGIAVAGGALALWSLLAVRAAGVEAVWRHKPLGLALLAVAVTLGSGPIDNVWHVAFGRDAVIWSPPHMLGIAGTFALGAAVLAELADREERWARVLATAAGGLLVAAAGFATVEYDTDVPQFDAVWYLPVLGFSAAIALSLVRLAQPANGAASVAALVHLVFVAAVSGFLLLLDFPAPALPLLVFPALVLDLAGRRGWPAPLTSAAYAVALFAAYVPARNALGDGVQLDAMDVLVGVPLTWLLATAVFALAAGRTPQPFATPVAAVTLALLLPAAALAHDPGQGDEAGVLGLRVAAGDKRIDLTGTIPQRRCEATTARRIVARRGGREVAAPLAKRGCSLRGTVTVPERGRWFVYAELRRAGRPVESWLPVDAGRGRQTATDSSRYAYIPPERSSSALKLIAGGILYALMLALLCATVALVRSAALTARTRPSTSDPRRRSA